MIGVDKTWSKEAGVKKNKVKDTQIGEARMVEV